MRLRGLSDIGATLAVLICRIALAVVISLTLLAVAPALLGLTSTVVMSDSMAPGIRAGDVVVVRPMPVADLHVGQVLLVDDPSFPGRLRLHRLAARQDGAFVLKGDANAQRDPTAVAADAVHGVGFLRVPGIGLPLLWLRTGDPLPAAAAVGAVAAAGVLVVVLDDTGSGGVLALRSIGRFVRRRRLGRLGIVGVVVVAAAVPVPPRLGPSSFARFVSTSSAPANTFTARTWCPALPKPVLTGGATGTEPQIAYSFAVTGTTETSVGTLGSGYSATLSTAALRAPGTCASGSSPSVRFSGGESIVTTGGYPPNTSGTQSLWFDATSATGVLADLGGATPGATTAERQLYFTSSGGLAFAVTNGGTPITCTVAASVTLNAWHLAAVVYDATAKSFTVYFDGQATSCTRTFTTLPASTPTLRIRIGNDATFASDAAGGSYAGSIDEVYSWGSTMPASSIDTIYAAGH